jgi:mono/diheme cytochrome c family protein
LDGFGSKAWIKGLLTNAGKPNDPPSPTYFGHTKLRTMTNWVEKRWKTAQKSQDAQARLTDEFDQIAGWLASHPRGAIPADSDASAFGQGYRAFANRCSSCHNYKDGAATGGGSADASDEGTAKGPDMTGYGDAEWVRLMLLSPASHLRYGSRNSMPAFRDLEGVLGEANQIEIQQQRAFLLSKESGDITDDNPDDAKKKQGQADKKKKDIEAATRIVQLNDIERELIIRFLLKDFRVVFGGEPISGPPKRAQ